MLRSLLLMLQTLLLRLLPPPPLLLLLLPRRSVQHLTPLSASYTTLLLTNTSCRSLPKQQQQHRALRRRRHHHHRQQQKQQQQILSINRLLLPLRLKFRCPFSIKCAHQASHARSLPSAAYCHTQTSTAFDPPPHCAITCVTKAQFDFNPKFLCRFWLLDRIFLRRLRISKLVSRRCGAAASFCAAFLRAVFTKLVCSSLHCSCLLRLSIQHLPQG
jgi:hypothetical protein